MQADRQRHSLEMVRLAWGWSKGMKAVSNSDIGWMDMVDAKLIQLFEKKMGKCMSGVSERHELRRTNVSEEQPFGAKTSERDYSFLRMSSDIREDPPQSNKIQSTFTAPELPEKDKEKPARKGEEEIADEMMDELPDHLQQHSNKLIKQDEDDELLNAYNTKSKIVKFSKRSSTSRDSKEIKCADRKQLLNSMKEDEVIEGTLTDQQFISTLSLKHLDIDMQFTLPRCRAGPLVVPCINFSAYSPC